jgi:hypothetical protein
MAEVTDAQLRIPNYSPAEYSAASACITSVASRPLRRKSCLSLLTVVGELVGSISFALLEGHTEARKGDSR